MTSGVGLRHRAVMIVSGVTFVRGSLAGTLCALIAREAGG